MIGELLGVPEADRAQFRDLVRDLVAVLEVAPTPAQLAAADAAQLEIREYFLASRGREAPASGRRPAERARAGRGRGDRLTDDELVDLASLLFGAGFETTTNLVGNGLLGLLQPPRAAGPAARGRRRSSPTCPTSSCATTARRSSRSATARAPWRSAA